MILSKYVEAEKFAYISEAKPMIIKVMSPRGVGTVIHVDYKNEQITIENKTDKLLDRAFGINQNPTWKDFEDFLEERCFPRTRDKMKSILREIGVQCYEPLSIIRKTGGRMAEDNLWLEIEDKG